MSNKMQVCVLLLLLCQVVSITCKHQQMEENEFAEFEDFDDGIF
jgi:hypothetical protein